MVTEADLKKYGFESEKREEARKTKPTFTGWPASLTRYRLFIEAYNMSMEESYFWILHYLEFYSGFNNKNILKITDVFSAAENSAFFGANQQRLGLQQDRVSQYLATIGKMVKELFQLVRELRILDERMSYYKDSYDAKSKSRESAEITLKGIWIDMVEQGAKNPASVYGMSREVQFTSLPDLFFSTHPLKPEDCDEVVEKTRAGFNRKVREVLKRKLRAFLEWKVHTFDELKNRRIFTLKYLRQHYEIIRMYMAWVRPYLKNIQRLQLDTDKTSRPDLLAAFETSIIEVELLAVKSPKEDWDYGSCINCHFLFRTRPEMSYQQEGYQRGPLHVGRMELQLRAYAWTKKQIDNYQKLKTEEDFKLLGLIDGSVRAAMESLGDELMRYLEEAGEEMTPRPKSTEKIKYSPLPFKSVLDGFKELFSFAKGSGEKKPTIRDEFILAENKKTASESARSAMWSVYHHYKKHHGMLNW